MSVTGCARKRDLKPRHFFTEPESTSDGSRERLAGPRLHRPIPDRGEEIFVLRCLAMRCSRHPPGTRNDKREESRSGCQFSLHAMGSRTIDNHSAVSAAALSEVPD